MHRSPWELERQPFAAHIQEIRYRLIIITLVLILTTSVGYVVREPLLAWLTAPLNQTLYYTSPGGGFSLVLQIALTFGIILTIPVALFQVVRFISPVLPPRSRLWLLAVITSSCGLAIIGMAAALFVSLPAALHFLAEFGGPSVQPLISTDRYFSFVLLYIGGFALLFQLPLLLVLLNQVVPLSTRTLMTKQRWIILGSFVVAAILTPTPDPMNQALMAIPMIGLYQVGIGAVWVANRPKRGDQFADAATRSALMALTHRKIAESWYAPHAGSHTLHCRWQGEHGGKTRELFTIVLNERHQLIPTPEVQPLS